MAAALLLVTVMQASTAAATPTLAEIEDEVMCTVCGVPLSMAREAPAAKRERALIEQLIAAGKSKDEIKAELVATYGSPVLAVPGEEGFDLVAWLVPITSVIVAVALLALLLVRWRRRSGKANDQPPVTALDPDDAARVEAELKARG